MNRAFRAGLALMLLTTACAAPAAPAAPAAQPTAAPLTHVTAAYSNIAPTVMPLWMAKEKGLFEKHGLDVDLQYVASATAVPAVISGQMQVAEVGGSEALGAIAGGADLVIVSMETPAYPYVMEVAPGLQSAEDLRGKSIGISRFGSSSDIATRVVLKSYGMDPDKDVNLVQTGSLSDRIAAMQSGAIQAGLAGPPDTITVERLGWKPLFDLAALGLPAVTLGQVIQRSYRDSNRSAVQAYVDSLIDGIAEVRRDRAGAIEVLRKYLKTDDEQQLNVSYDYFTRPELMPSLPYPRPEQFSDTVAILGQKNEQLGKLDVPSVLDTSFIKSAEDRGLGK
jgi:ABC-type nitrate/sulfonate/bicarbonate transport system substrate-binding protein